MVVAEASKGESRTKRSRSLDRNFYGVALDENRLAKIATRIKELTERSFSISVKSSDGEENVEIEDPELFADSSMPSNLGRVTISGYGSAFVFLNLDPKYVSLSVSSDNAIHARAVFSEIERELQLCLEGYSWFARLLDGPISVLIWLSLYLALTLATFYLAFPSLQPTRPAIKDIFVPILSMVGASLTIATIVTLSRSFPLLRFYGRYHDSSRRPRAVLSIIAFSILLPMGVRLLYEQFRH